MPGEHAVIVYSADTHTAGRQVCRQVVIHLFHPVNIMQYGIIYVRAKALSEKRQCVYDMLLMSFKDKARL